MTTVEVLPLRSEPEYPESDGQPMGETDTHRDAMNDHIKALQAFLRERADVYVAGNLFVYYEQGNPRAVVAPDVFVVKGVSNQRRKTFKVWEEGETPCFVIEVTSKSTRREDTEGKKELYSRLGVDEYFLFDPLGEYLEPRLQGFRLAQGRYGPMEPASDGSLTSETVGVRLALEGEHLRLRNKATGEELLRFEEEHGRRQKAEEGWQAEKVAREQAEVALQKAEEARQQAEARAWAAEEELERLKPR